MKKKFIRKEDELLWHPNRRAIFHSFRIRHNRISDRPVAATKLSESTRKEWRRKRERERERGDGLINLFAVDWQKKCRSCSLVVGRVSLPQRTTHTYTQESFTFFFSFISIFLRPSISSIFQRGCSIFLVQHFADELKKKGSAKIKTRGKKVPIDTVYCIHTQ